ncbi:hypothetical protein [Runella aurantiaca]|uniref:Uncharacterized protein n=1 Tax=Runella aurantiaca TaxID=2282308 RepID=A0A369IHF2_9BACT|nr:hypothetical protein [Runella aurantiaca]RDB07615.1 hypothetical protein DVG78_00675 [Runella aurantiaca]
MLKAYFSLLIFGFSLTAIAQQTDNQLTNTARDLINLNGFKINANNANTGLFDIKGPKGNVVGNPYLDSTWQTGSIKLYKKIGPPGREGDSIGNVPLRLDLFVNELEIKIASTQDVRVLAGDYIRFFTLEGPERRIFLNVNQFRSEDNMKGFVELIKGGRLSLVELTKLSIIKPNYNEAMALGSKDTKIVKNNQYFVVKGNTLISIGTSKKKLLDAMADRADDVDEFIKTNKLSLKSRPDITKVFAYYNNL